MPGLSLNLAEYTDFELGFYIAFGRRTSVRGGEALLVFFDNSILQQLPLRKKGSSSKLSMMLLNQGPVQRNAEVEKCRMIHMNARLYLV